MHSRRRRRRRLIVISLALLFIAAGGAFVAVWYHFRGAYVGIEPDRASYPMRGIDVSSHNGVIDFNRVRADSIDFVIIKASEGVSFKDAGFNVNYRNALRAGLKVGAYHFFRFDCTGYMQALNFMHSVRGKDLHLPLVIDVEEWTNPTTFTTDHIVGELRNFINELEKNGYSVMLYTNKDGYRRFIVGNFERYPLWICDLKGVPESSWHLWQYSHRGKIRGIDGSVDFNTFNGPRDLWESWALQSASSTQ